MIAAIKTNFHAIVCYRFGPPQITDLKASHGIDNLLYSADADFSCFADLAVTSPTDYYTRAPIAVRKRTQTNVSINHN